MSLRCIKAENVDYCPFCGKHDITIEIIEWQKDELECSVGCEDCGANTGCYATIEQATNAWNMRCYK